MSPRWGAWLAACAIASATLIGTYTVRASRPEPAAVETKDKEYTPAVGDPVTIIFKSGRIVTGKILALTKDAVKVKGSERGINFENEFSRGDIVAIRPSKPEGDAKGDVAKGDIEKKPDAKPADTKPEPTIAPGDPAAQVVYWIPLKGQLGEDITQKPLKRAIDDARKQKANVIIMTLDAAEIVNAQGRNLDEQMAWNLIFRMEELMPIFTDQIPKEWDHQPRVVTWVKQAMGAAAFLPFMSKEIYFHPDGRMGGLGTLSFLFGSTGDDVVREKQRSLRLGHAEGWANWGGYDYRLIRAMARAEYVLSVRFVGGKPELFEGLPTNPGEELLTDDGKDANEDTLSQKVAGTGNDVLTLNARYAQLLGVSKGNAESEDELIDKLGIGRTAVQVKKPGERIMKEWSEGVDSAKRQILKLIREFTEVQVEPPAGWNERTKARSTRIRKLEDIKRLLDQWGEGITGLWRGENGIPDIAAINTRIEAIKLEQIADKKK